MKQTLFRGFSLMMALLVTMSLCVSVGAVEISPRASDYLNQYNGLIMAKGDGDLKVSFSVVGTRILDEIGASLIRVQEKNGSSWKTVATYDNIDTPELSTTNNYSYAEYIMYTGKIGKEYRAQITVFGNTDYRTFTTNSVVAKK